VVAGFRDRYGPWALVAGAAVGLGAQWARQLAAADLVLIDRDGPLLETTAAEIEAGHGVSVRPVTLDLARGDLLVALGPEVADREIGLVVRPTPPSASHRSLSLDAGQLQAIIDVNCRAPDAASRTRCRRRCMRAGVAASSSCPRSPATSARRSSRPMPRAKAFALVAADALWAELRPLGVDVLAVQPGSTRTPGWLSSQPRGGRRHGGLPVMETADVVREALTPWVDVARGAGRAEWQVARRRWRVSAPPGHRADERGDGRLVPNHRPRH
jgi:short-subunit dehydrogenase